MTRHYQYFLCLFCVCAVSVLPMLGSQGAMYKHLIFMFLVLGCVFSKHYPPLSTQKRVEKIDLMFQEAVSAGPGLYWSFDSSEDG